MSSGDGVGTDEFDALRETAPTDAVEEHRAHAAVQAAMFGRTVQPIALGRYVLLHQLGSGGGGTVYQSYDPQLHRRVAIKVLQCADDSEALLREARLVAGLSHPNIVAVHDVGYVPASAARALGGGGVYMVMELVDGVDLETWRSERERRWGELLEVLLEAGRGVEAAHRAGIVHRDIKPHNILVGSDGRARVLDFGLAATAADDGGIDARSGTPRYMAPEQHAGEMAGRHTDQYGFCVTAWQVLFGAHPFDAPSVQELHRAKRAGPPEAPGGDVPRRVAAALRRGLQPDPNARYPDMTALLRALEPRQARGRRPAATVAVLAIGAVALALLQREDGGPCDDVEQRLRATWGSGQRERARNAFAAVSTPYAEDAWAKASEHFDHWADAWSATYRSACDGHLAADARAQRSRCLDRQLERLDSASRLLTEADDTIVRHAVSIVDGLPDPRSCEDDPTAQAEPDPVLEAKSPAEREPLLALRAKMREAKLLRQAGKVEEAGTIAAEIEARAEELDDRRMLAESRILTCQLGRLHGSTTEREQRCLRALEAAEKSGSEKLPIVALVTLAELVGQPDEPERAEAWFHAVAARLDAAPRYVRTPSIMSWYLTARGNHEFSKGRYEASRKLFERAIDAAEEADSPTTLPALLALAGVAERTGRIEDAQAYHRRVSAIAMDAYGEFHPRTAMVANNYGNFLLEMGRDEAAAEQLERALELKRTTLGDDSRALVTTLSSLSRAYRRLGRHTEALASADEALRLVEALFPETSERRALAVAEHNQALRELGRCEESLPELQALESRAIASTERPRFDLSKLSVAVGRCLQSRGDQPGARAAFERALTASEAYWGDEHRRLVPLLREVGSDDALARAERIVQRTELHAGGIDDPG